MIFEQLADEKQQRNFFVYLTNRPDPFQMLESDSEAIGKRIHGEISMGYTDLWIMERISIYKKGELLLTNDVAMDNTSTQAGIEFYVFPFFTLSSGPGLFYSNFDQLKGHSTLADAKAYAERTLKKKQAFYKSREYTAVCAALLRRHMWH